MQTNKLLELLNLAERYDALGLFIYADKIMASLAPYIDQFPTEAKLRIQGRGNGLGSQSMGSTERGKGFMYLKGGEYEYMSGKGQQCFKEDMPMNMSWS